MKRISFRGLTGSCVLLLSALACEPVFAIGWRELLVVFLVMALLLGPPLIGLIRKIVDFRRHGRKEK